MYIGIFKLVLKKRFFLKINSIIKLLRKWNIVIVNEKIILTVFFAFKAFAAIMIGVIMSLLIDEKYLQCVICLIILINMAEKFIDGGLDYKNTHIFPYEEIKQLSVAKDSKIYRTQIIGALVYNFFNDGLLWSSLVYLICSIIKYNLNAVVVFNFVSSSILGFVLGNIVVGKYIYAIVVKKITILRFVVYIGNVLLIIFGIIKVGNSTSLLMKEHFIGKFNNWGALLDDAYIESLFENIGSTILNELLYLNRKLVDLGLYLFSSIFGVVCLGGIVIVLMVRVNLISIRKKKNLFEGEDGLTVLLRYFRLLGKNKGLFVKNQIERLKEYRWFMAKPFFQLVFMDYESVAYIALLSFVAYQVDDYVFTLQVIICMTVMVMANQCMNLRSSAYIYFSLTMDIKQIKLLKMSLAKADTIWKTKEQIFSFFMIIPSIITIVFNIAFAVYMGLSGWNIIVIGVVWLGCIWIMPLIQMHMIPLVSNVEIIAENQIGEDFLEDEIADKMQEFPRVFLVVIPILVTVGMLFFGSIRNQYLIIVELLYWILATCIIYVYLSKIRNKGVEKIIDKVF